ncbi:MAG TPA: ATP-binding protein [Candidatus Baltobacteraceae bacterium]|nr:ATP-binding protein [Candidatus Baltobacteraceae bacterium]
MRSDLVLALVQAASERDDLLLRRTVDAMIADERAKRHHTFAEKLASKASVKRSATADPRTLGPRTEELAFQTEPRRSLSSLYLADNVRESISELIEEHHRVELLRSYGLEPRNRILLIGPPGNGKTSLAEAVAEALMVPLYIVRYEGIIANLLGDTARRINVLIERIASVPSVLFFDEFDAIAKFRGDENESGEIKRLVTSLLGHLDRLAPHVVVIAATNHPELLDRAIWRRFDLHVTLERPDRSRLREWIDAFIATLEQPSPYSPEDLVKRLCGRSYSELEQFRNTVRRRIVLRLPSTGLRRIMEQALLSLERRPVQGDPAGGSTSTITASAPETRPGD